MEGRTIEKRGKKDEGTKALIQVLGPMIALLIGLFLWVANGVNNSGLDVIDGLIYDYISGIRGEGMTSAMVLVSFLGGANFLIFLSLMFFYIFKKMKKGYWDPLFVLINLFGVWILNAQLKLAYQRPRPTVEHLVEASGYSFPSGHSMIGFAFYGFMAYMIHMNVKSSGKRNILVGFMILLALGIGVSRIYLGVHYPSDVLGGFLGGAAWMGICIGFHQWSLSGRRELKKG